MNEQTNTPNKLLELIACPVDKGPLEFVSWTSTQKTPAGTTLDGMLVNRRLKIAYPVMNHVPRLLPLDAEGWSEFASLGNERLARELPGFSLPAAN